MTKSILFSTLILISITANADVPCDDQFKKSQDVLRNLTNDPAWKRLLETGWSMVGELKLEPGRKVLVTNDKGETVELSEGQILLDYQRPKARSFRSLFTGERVIRLWQGDEKTGSLETSTSDWWRYSKFTAEDKQNNVRFDGSLKKEFVRRYTERRTEVCTTYTVTTTCQGSHCYPQQYPFYYNSDYTAEFEEHAHQTNISIKNNSGETLGTITGQPKKVTKEVKRLSGGC